MVWHKDKPCWAKAAAYIGLNKAINSLAGFLKFVLQFMKRGTEKLIIFAFL
jgi:hypothetical protein